MDSSVPFKNRLGPMIGAWGYKFFESDHDYDIVAHLSADMGLSLTLPTRISQMQDSLLNPKNRTFVVKYLQDRGELNTVFQKYFDMLKVYQIVDAKATKAEEIMIDSPRYYISLLGLLGMQLGCKLPRAHRRWMKANWNACLFMYERIDQAKMAVFEYENGKPLKLDSKTLNEKMLFHSGGSRVIVPNHAVQASIMRMYLDNEAAKSKGGTSFKGADISNVFAYAPDSPALEQTASQNRKNTPAKNDDMPDPPKILAQEGVKITQWALNEAGEHRLKQHGDLGVSVENFNAAEMAKHLEELFKNGELG